MCVQCTMYMNHSTRTQNTFTLHRQQLYRRINTNTSNAFGRIYFFRPISIQLPYYFDFPLSPSFSASVFSRIVFPVHSNKTRWQETIIDSFFFFFGIEVDVWNWEYAQRREKTERTIEWNKMQYVFCSKWNRLEMKQ